MEEAKAAAYYEQLIREGEGAAKFKQGLGYSSAGPTDAAPSWRSSASDLSGFVRSSSGGNADSDAGKEARLSAVKAKLLGKSGSFRDSDRTSSRSSRGGEERRTRRSRSRSRSPRRHERPERRKTSRRSLSPRREERSPERRRSRSRSRSPRRHERSEMRKTSRRSLSPRREKRSPDMRRRSRSRSSSPRRRSERSRREDGKGRGRSSSGKEKATEVDYSKLIKGYTNMTSAERIKAKMKLQLSQTAAKDKVMGKGWERFEFDKDAPLDDEEIEVADDDANLVKHMDKTFRFSSLEVKRESDLEAAHDEAIFGVPSALPDSKEYEDADGMKGQDMTENSTQDANLVSEKVLSMQRGSWRDKVRNHQKG